MIRYVILLALFFTIGTLTGKNDSIHSAIKIDFEKLYKEEEQENYSLNEIIELIADSLRDYNPPPIPKNVTEAERLIFTARNLIHYNDPLAAIYILKHLLERNFYRTEGERFYLNYLIGFSLYNMGFLTEASVYTNQAFPELIEYVDQTNLKVYYLNKYNEFLIASDSVDTNLVLKTYQQVIQLCIKNENWGDLVSTQNNYAFYCKGIGLLDSASYYFKQNQQGKYKVFSPILHAFSFGNYAQVLKEKNQFDSVAYFLKKELHLLKEANSTDGIDNLYFGLGDYYQNISQDELALISYDSAIFYARHKNNFKVVTDAYEQRLQIMTQLKDPNLLDSMQRYFFYNDLLQNSLKKRSKENEMKFSYYIASHNDAVSSKKEADQLRSRNIQLMYSIISLSIVLSAIVFIVLLRQKSRHKLAVANEELHQKNISLNQLNEINSKSSQRNEILLKELHHRVKNNLQIISSLFNLQLSIKEFDEKTTSLFNEAKDRVHSISLVHKKMYQSDNIDKLDFGDYLKDFSRGLLGMDHSNVTIEFDIPAVLFSIDSAIPLGLIFNELLTNSLKHAKAEKDLKILVLHQKVGQECKFIFTDNGQGVNPAITEKDIPNSMGIFLIKILATQLEAEIEFKESKAEAYGFWFSIQGNFQ